MYHVVDWRGRCASDLLVTITVDESISYDPYIWWFWCNSFFIGDVLVKRNVEVSRCVYDFTLYGATSLLQVEHFCRFVKSQIEFYEGEKMWVFLMYFIICRVCVSKICLCLMHNIYVYCTTNLTTHTCVANQSYQP